MSLEQDNLTRICKVEPISPENIVILKNNLKKSEENKNGLCASNESSSSSVNELQINKSIPDKSIEKSTSDGISVTTDDKSRSSMSTSVPTELQLPQSSTGKLFKNFNEDKNGEKNDDPNDNNVQTVNKFSSGPLKLVENYNNKNNPTTNLPFGITQPLSDSSNDTTLNTNFLCCVSNNSLDSLSNYNLKNFHNRRQHGSDYMLLFNSSSEAHISLDGMTLLLKDTPRISVPINLSMVHHDNDKIKSIKSTTTPEGILFNDYCLQVSNDLLQNMTQGRLADSPSTSSCGTETNIQIDNPQEGSENSRSCIQHMASSTKEEKHNPSERESPLEITTYAKMMMKHSINAPKKNCAHTKLKQLKHFDNKVMCSEKEPKDGVNSFLKIPKSLSKKLRSNSLMTGESSSSIASETFSNVTRVCDTESCDKRFGNQEEHSDVTSLMSQASQAVMDSKQSNNFNQNIPHISGPIKDELMRIRMRLEMVHSKVGGDQDVKFSSIMKSEKFKNSDENENGFDDDGGEKDAFQPLYCSNTPPKSNNDNTFNGKYTLDITDVCENHDNSEVTVENGGNLNDAILFKENTNEFCQKSHRNQLNDITSSNNINQINTNANSTEMFDISSFSKLNLSHQFDNSVSIEDTLYFYDTTFGTSKFESDKGNEDITYLQQQPEDLTNHMYQDIDTLNDLCNSISSGRNKYIFTDGKSRVNLCLQEDNNRLSASILDSNEELNNYMVDEEDTSYMKPVVTGNDLSYLEENTLGHPNDYVLDPYTSYEMENYGLNNNSFFGQEYYPYPNEIDYETLSLYNMNESYEDYNYGHMIDDVNNFTGNQEDHMYVIPEVLPQIQPSQAYLGVTDPQEGIVSQYPGGPYIDFIPKIPDLQCIDTCYKPSDMKYRSGLYYTVPFDSTGRVKQQQQQATSKSTPSFHKNFRPVNYDLYKICQAEDHIYSSGMNKFQATYNSPSKKSHYEYSYDTTNHSGVPFQLELAMNGDDIAEQVTEGCLSLDNSIKVNDSTERLITEDVETTTVHVHPQFSKDQTTAVSHTVFQSNTDLIRPINTEVKAPSPEAKAILETFKTNTSSFNTYSLKDIQGLIVDFCKDQHGSRFIQQKMEKSSNGIDRDFVFKEITSDETILFNLMTDVFGNYVVQKMLEYGTENHKRNISGYLFGHVLSLTTQMYGCRVIQKAIECIPRDLQTRLIHELDGHVLECVKDQNGNHVIQKCIEYVPAENLEFIILEFNGRVFELSSHPYGCRVIQRLMEHCSPEQTQGLMLEIFDNLPILVKDQYGNYVIQHILDHKKHVNFHGKIIHFVFENIFSLSAHKFASNVVEKCIQFSNVQQRENLVRFIIRNSDGGVNDNLFMMMKDPFANYVIQKIVDCVTGDHRKQLLLKMKPFFLSLKKLTYGKHMINKIDRWLKETETMTTTIFHCPDEFPSLSDNT